MTSFLAGLIAGWLARVVVDRVQAWRLDQKCHRVRWTFTPETVPYDDRPVLFADPPDPRPVEFETWLRRNVKP